MVKAGAACGNCLSNETPAPLGEELVTGSIETPRLLGLIALPISQIFGPRDLQPNNNNNDDDQGDERPLHSRKMARRA